MAADPNRTAEIQEKARHYIRALRLSRVTRQRHLSITNAKDFVSLVNEAVRTLNYSDPLTVDEIQDFNAFVNSPDKETESIKEALANLSSGDVAVAMRASNGPGPGGGAADIVKRVICKLQGVITELEAALDDLDERE